MDPDLQRAIAYWLDHPWRAVAVYALATFVGGFVRQAARDVVAGIINRRRRSE